MTPNSGPADRLTAPRGFGFGAGEQVSLFWENAFGFLFYTFADINGSFNTNGGTTISVPSGAASGRHNVIGVGQSTAVRGYGPFTVE